MGKRYGHEDGDAALRVQTIKPPRLVKLDLEAIVSFERAYQEYINHCRQQGARISPIKINGCLDEWLKEMVAVHYLKESSEVTEDEVTKFLEAEKQKEIESSGSVNMDRVFSGLKMKTPQRRDQIMTYINEYICDILRRLNQAGLKQGMMDPQNNELRKKLVPAILKGVWPLGV